MDKIEKTIKEINELGFATITLSESQVSQIIGVSVGTLKNWRDKLIGPQYKKMGTGKKGKVIYTKQSVATWLCETN